MDTRYAGSNQAQAAPPTTNPSMFGTVEFAASNAASIANRVCATVERLCGAYPAPAEGKSVLTAAPNGLLDEGMRNAASISENMGRIADALDRLDRALP